MKFCSRCGSAVQERVPPGDDRPRPTCTACGEIHYTNPKPVVGCLVEHAGRLLLCRRAIEPGHGLWTLPAGYLELGESSIEGAVRETLEEANARVDVLAMHSHLDVPHIGQSYTIFRAQLADGAFSAGPESLAVELFDVEALPWDELAFPVIYFALKLYLEDLAAKRFAVHHGVVEWAGEGSRFDWRQYAMRGHLVVPLDGAQGAPPAR